MRSYQGTKGYCYGAYELQLSLADSKGVERVSTSVFYAVDMEDDAVILGRPWRAKNGVLAHSTNDSWMYTSVSDAVDMREAWEFAADMKESGNAYAVVVRRIGNAGSLGADASVGEDSAGAPKLPDDFVSYSDVFAYDEHAVSKLPTDVEHEINLVDGKKPPFKPLYHQSQRELDELKVYLDKALRFGWISRSTSEAGAPILFVPKKDGRLRLCVDYRGLNEITIKDRCPLPLISETLDRLRGAQYFTTLDLTDAYYRIPIRRSDRWKTAFRTRYGHFEYNVMPFGLTNAPATFQGYINRALSGLVDEYCVVYLDDILIYSESREEHVRHVCAVLERLRKFALYGNLKKCSFFQKEVSFLGFVISNEGIAMEPSRVEAVVAWPRLKTYADIQRFLGFANFYRRFIRWYSKIVKPFTDLLVGMKNGRKPGGFEWGDAEEQAFSQIKAAFQQAPLLRHFDPNLPLRLETDASGFAVAAILSQLFGSEWHPIAFWSRKMIPAETRYEVHDQELLAVAEAFKVWRQYFHGAQHAIQVRVDHANLQGFMKMKQLNGRQARWAVELSPFDFYIEHQAGKKNPADAPSRRPDYADVEQVTSTLLPTLQSKLALWTDRPVGDDPLEERVKGTCKEIASTIRAVRVESSIHGVTALPVRIARAMVADEEPYANPSDMLKHAVRILQKHDPDMESLRTEAEGEGGEYTLREDLLFRGQALYIPNDPAIRAQVIRMHHDDALAGHFGRAKTKTLISRKYFWPKMMEDVAEYIDSCETCQKNRSRRHRPYGDLQSLPLPTEPWKEITMDFITDLPPSMRDGCVYDAILVIVDRFSKMNVYVPTTKTCNAVTLAKILVQEVVRRFGVPRGIVSDRGSVFTSKFWSDFCYEAHITRKLSTAFHPQTDGQTERANQTLEQYLRCYCSEFQDDWAELLPQAEFAYNNSDHAANGMSPFSVVHTWNPELATESRGEILEEGAPAAQDAARRMKEVHKTLADRWKQASESQARGYNKKHQLRTYKVGDMVLLSTKNLRLDVPKKKLGPKFAGPFKIIDAVGTQAYRLALPAGSRIHNVFNVSLLEPYISRGGEQPAEDLRLADDEGEWEVEKVIGEKTKKGKKYFLLHWRGWPAEYDQWEPQENCTHVSELIKEWRESRKKKKA